MAASDKICNLLDTCGTPEAPLCPLQDTTLKNGIWYGDEPICLSEMFQNLHWIKMQKTIAAMKLTADDGFFTVRMLSSLKNIDENIKGADPADDKGELNWLNEHRIKLNKPYKRRSTSPSKQLQAGARLF